MYKLAPGTSPVLKNFFATSVLAVAILPVAAMAQTPFTTGNLVVAVSGCGVHAGTCTAVPNGTGDGTGNSSVGGYGDNQATPLTLFQFTPVGTTTATYVDSLVLPQTASGNNFPVSAEYGSSSEGSIQLSGNGRYLTIMGYAIPAATFDANPPLYGAAPSNALAQSGSLTGQSYTPVGRVVALIDANGAVISNTPIYNIFNTNNPRSIYTVNGTSAWVSGQGTGAGTDPTGGVFYTPLGAPNSAPTPITGLDTTGNTLSQDTRIVQIINNTLYVSVDTKGGKNSARSYIGTLGPVGGPAPTTTVGGPVMLTGYGNTGGTGKLTITTGANGDGNNLNAGLQVNASPVGFFFANASTLYVADSGHPKNDSNPSTLGDGGLQKWINTKTDGTGTWNLAYTLYKGLNLVANTSAAGTTGLYGLTANVSGNLVQLYATNYTINDLDQTFLYGITDNLTFTTAAQAASESFNVLATAPSDSNFKGVSFAPTRPAIATPVITWHTPAAITYGSALSSDQLNATANVPGTFVYNPPAGTVPPVGSNQTLSVTFTPTNTDDYYTTTGSTTITVNAAAATPANLVTTKVLTRSGGNIVVKLTIANTGTTAAANVVLTTVKVGSASATPLPQSLGTIAPGTSVIATVTVPGTVGAAGAASSVSVSGTYTGSTFTAGARVTLP